VYTLDEIIASIASKKVAWPEWTDAVSDAVDPCQYLSDLFGSDAIRVHQTFVPVASLRILQPDIEMWRYLRLCALPKEDYRALVERLPLVVVRGRGITDYPLLQGNHRALYALMHGCEELPARVHVLTDETASAAFLEMTQHLYRELDVRFGSHGVGALREAYKRLLTQVVELRKREHLFRHGDLFSTRTGRYRQLRRADETVSAEIPCLSLDGYVQTLYRMFHIPRASLALSFETLFYRGLVLTQPAVEREKLARIATTPALFDAPILVTRTRQLDYVSVGHTRLRARLAAGIRTVQAMVVHVDHDGLNGFLDKQARQSGYLTGNEGIRRMGVI